MEELPLAHELVGWRGEICRVALEWVEVVVEEESDTKHGFGCAQERDTCDQVGIEFACDASDRLCLLVVSLFADRILQEIATAQQEFAANQEMVDDGVGKIGAGTS